MSHDHIRALMIQLMDEHPEKFIFLMEKPDFACWFVGRIMGLTKRKVDETIVLAVVMEATK